MAAASCCTRAETGTEMPAPVAGACVWVDNEGGLVDVHVDWLWLSRGQGATWLLTPDE